MTWDRDADNLVPFPPDLEAADLDRLELHATRNGGTISRRLRRLDIGRRVEVEVVENKRGEEEEKRTKVLEAPAGCRLEDGGLVVLAVEGGWPGRSVDPDKPDAPPAKQWDGVAAVWFGADGKEFEPLVHNLI